MNLYDFDKTIFYKDSGSLFLFYIVRKKFSLFPYLLKAGFYACLWGLKIVSAETFKTKAFSVLKRIDAEKIAQEFWDEYKDEHFPYYDGNLQEDDVICSASPEFLVKAFFDKVNPTATVIATKCDIATGETEGKNCKGEEKVARLNALGFTEFENVYSDSLTDIPILKMGKNSYLIKKGVPIPFEIKNR